MLVVGHSKKLCFHNPSISKKPTSLWSYISLPISLGSGHFFEERSLNISSYIHWYHNIQFTDLDLHQIQCCTHMEKSKFCWKFLPQNCLMYCWKIPLFPQKNQAEDQLWHEMINEVYNWILSDNILNLFPSGYPWRQQVCHFQDTITLHPTTL